MADIMRTANSEQRTANSEQRTANSHNCNTFHEPRYKVIREEINGQTLEYESRIFESETANPIQEDEARRLFLKTKEEFDKAGIKFALVFGTLLGAVREGSTIRGDQDMDICVWDEERLRENLISFQKNGLKVCRILPGLLYSFRFDSHCYIDAYIFRELRGWKLLPWRLNCVSLGGWVSPRKFLSEWSEIEFFGEKVTCPANPVRLLEFWYGSDWRIPQDKKGTYNVSSFRYTRRIFGAPINILKLIFSSKYRQKILRRKKKTGSFFS